MATKQIHEAVEVIAAAIDPENKLGIAASDLKATKNPEGDGALVFVSAKRSEPRRRLIPWLVIDGRGYTLNVAAKALTPELPWPMEADLSRWKRTGLEAHRAVTALQKTWIALGLFANPNPTRGKGAAPY